jgi:hypothetical protein
MLCRYSHPKTARNSTPSEFAENGARKDFLPTEILAIRRAMEPSDTFASNMGRFGMTPAFKQMLFSPPKG